MDTMESPDWGMESEGSSLFEHVIQRHYDLEAYEQRASIGSQPRRRRESGSSEAFERTLEGIRRVEEARSHVLQQRRIELLMGSFGTRVWRTCYWCNYWVQDPFIIDWIGRPLCNLCVDWHMGWGRFQTLNGSMPSNAAEWERSIRSRGPFWPSARDRNIKFLLLLRPPKNPHLALDLEICEYITEFLCEWHEP